MGSFDRRIFPIPVLGQLSRCLKRRYCLIIESETCLLVPSTICFSFSLLNYGFHHYYKYSILIMIFLYLPQYFQDLHMPTWPYILPIRFISSSPTYSTFSVISIRYIHPLFPETLLSHKNPGNATGKLIINDPIGH